VPRRPISPTSPTQLGDLSINGTSIVGIIFCLLTLAIGAACHLLLEKETGALLAAKTYSTGDAAGTEVLIEGKVSDKNDLLVHRFVHAERETFQEARGSIRSYWKTEQQFNQPLILTVGAEEVILIVDAPVVRGKESMTIVDPSNSQNRWRGISRGAVVTAVGTVSSNNPATIEATADNVYGSDREGYAADAAFVRRALFITIGIALLIGIGIIVLGAKRR